MKSSIDLAVSKVVFIRCPDARRQSHRAAELAVQRARYEAERAFTNVEPENRLVARSLEARWETKLAQLADAEAALATAQATTAPAPEQNALRALAADLPRLWDSPTTSHRDRKRLLRSVIADITLLPATDDDSVRIGVRWHTGATDELTALRHGPGRTPAGALELVRRYGATHTSEQLAERLNAAGLLTGKGKPFTAAGIARVRDAYKIWAPRRACPTTNARTLMGRSPDPVFVLAQGAPAPGIASGSETRWCRLRFGDTFAGVPTFGSEAHPTNVVDFPPIAQAAVNSLVSWAQAAFAESLVSIIVHGSLAWGCWGPSSDIDALLVVDERVRLTEFHEMLVAGDGQAPGNGFELSVLSRAAARSSLHPIDYLYHFSRGRLARQSPQHWDLCVVERDPDLAGHLLVAWTTGVCAFGLPARQVLRRVNDVEFFASIKSDVLESCEEVFGLTAERVPVPVYAVLNFARTLAWLQERAVLSKREGGHWLMERDRNRTALLTAALEEYADPRGRMALTADLHSLVCTVREHLATDEGSIT